MESNKKGLEIMQLFYNQSLMEEFDNFVSMDTSQKNLGKEPSSPVASSPKLPGDEVEEEEHEFMDITSDDDVDDKYSNLRKLTSEKDLKKIARAHASSNVLYGEGMDAHEHVIKKHKGHSFDLPTSHECSEKSKEQNTHETELGISPISRTPLAISGEDAPVDINVSGEDAPVDINVAGEDAPVDINVSGEDAPVDINVSGEDAPVDINVSGEDAPVDINVSGEDAPVDINVAGEHGPVDINIAGEHGPVDINVAGEHGLVDINVSGEDGPVDINAYKVKATTAPLLKAIFAKYGDITTNCSYKSLSMKTSVLEVLCNTIQTLRCSDIEAVLANLEVIENELSDVEASKIEVSWLNKYLEKVRKVAALRNNSLQLREDKVTSGIVTSSVSKELQQRRAELQKVYERFNKAKQREAAMKIVGKKIVDNVRLLEAEEAFLIQGRLNELP